MDFGFTIISLSHGMRIIGSRPIPFIFYSTQTFTVTITGTNFSSDENKNTHIQTGLWRLLARLKPMTLMLQGSVVYYAAKVEDGNFTTISMIRYNVVKCSASRRDEKKHKIVASNRKLERSPGRSNK